MDAMLEARAAAVAGSFYPREAEWLMGEVEGLLEEASRRPRLPHAPKALIVPHAGYAYSGPIAASAYAQVARLRGIVRRVVVLGPAHRAWVPGLALPGARAFETPLGRIPVDPEAPARLAPFRQVITSPAGHALEHSIEVQLPFLQRVLGPFQLVPLVVGQAAAEDVAEVLEALWGGPETLLVVSSDLSHDLPGDRAEALDRQTCEAIGQLRLLQHPDQACGAIPVNGLLLAARRRGLTPHLLDLRNSGDTGGEARRVVGYAAIAFCPEVGHGLG